MVEKLIDGVMHTKESVCRQYEGYVYKESHKQKGIAARLGYDLDDLTSEGYIGLLKAFDRFDYESFETRFSTFAIPYISGSISNSLRTVNVGAHYPQDIKSIGFKMKREGLTELTPEEIAEKLNIKPHLVIRAKDFLLYRFPAFLDKPIIDSEGEPSSWLNTMMDGSDESAEEVNDFLCSMTPKERAIIAGLEMGFKQQEIGVSIGITQVRVSKAIKIIRDKYLAYFGEGSVKKEEPKRRNRKK